MVSQLMQRFFDTGGNEMNIYEKAIIGLLGIAIQHIDDEKIDKARDTLMGLIMSIEGRQEQ